MQQRTILSAAALILTVPFAAGRPGAVVTSGQAGGSARGTDAQQCQALLTTDFGKLPDAPTRVTSARLVDVPPADPKLPPSAPASLLAASPIKQYCQVIGYVAPQNKFELRLPLAENWNGRFHLTPCAGFCGGVRSAERRRGRAG